MSDQSEMKTVITKSQHQREALLRMHDRLTTAAKVIMAQKNHDYSKNGPFDNFKVCEALQITSAENGILIRMGDKLSRLASVLEKGARVKDEAILDTVVDIINYAVLLYGVHHEKREQELTVPQDTARRVDA